MAFDSPKIEVFNVLGSWPQPNFLFKGEVIVGNMQGLQSKSQTLIRGNRLIEPRTGII